MRSVGSIDQCESSLSRILVLGRWCKGFCCTLQYESVRRQYRCDLSSRLVILFHGHRVSINSTYNASSIEQGCFATVLDPVYFVHRATEWSKLCGDHVYTAFMKIKLCSKCDVKYCNHVRTRHLELIYTRFIIKLKTHKPRRTSTSSHELRNFVF